MPKPRITIEPSDVSFQPYVFVVRWRGLGWKHRKCLSWTEALYAAGVLKDPHAS